MLWFNWIAEVISRMRSCNVFFLWGGSGGVLYSQEQVSTMTQVPFGVLRYCQHGCTAASMGCTSYTAIPHIWGEPIFPKAEAPLGWSPQPSAYESSLSTVGSWNQLNEQWSNSTVSAKPLIFIGLGSVAFTHHMKVQSPWIPWSHVFVSLVLSNFLG